MPVVVSAPGKIILMGEHAAVYGKPALIAAIDRRLQAVFEVDAGAVEGSVRLDLPAVGIEETTSWRALDAYAETRRKAWQRYAEEPSPARFAEVRGDDPAHLVKVALGVARAAIGVDWQAPAIRLRVHSEIPVGGGFGSSAAVAVGLVHGTFCLAERTPEAEELANLALAAERCQHGQPSGVDSATVQVGGLLWAERDENGALLTRQVRLANALLGHFEVFDTGTPLETTGEVVSVVRHQVESAPERGQTILDEIEQATRSLRLALEGARGTRTAVAQAVRAAHRGLQALGVVPPAVGRVIRQLAAGGVAAKLSGAGALTGTGAGSLLVYDRAAQAHSDGSSPAFAFPRLALQLGAPGVRCDRG